MARILIVDDEAAFRGCLKKVLDAAGHQAFCAGSGREALQIIQEISPELVLLDMFMPEMDGIEMMQQLQNDSSRKIVAMSGAPGEWQVLKIAEKLGAKRTLMKPFSHREALRVIDEVLQGTCACKRNGDPIGT